MTQRAVTKLTQRAVTKRAVTKRAMIGELVVRRAGLGLRDATVLVNAMFDAMSEVLVRGDRIEIRGFGSFAVKQRTARQGRNPRTGARVRVEAKRVPFFRAGKELRLELNGDTSDPPDHPG